MIYTIQSTSAAYQNAKLDLKDIDDTIKTISYTAFDNSLVIKRQGILSVISKLEIIINAMHDCRNEELNTESFNMERYIELKFKVKSLISMYETVQKHQKVIEIPEQNECTWKSGPRLSKISREFDLDIDDIVSLLSNYAHVNVENSPNTRLTIDQYNWWLEHHEKLGVKKKS